MVITEPPAFVDERAPVLDAERAKLVAEIETRWGAICQEKAKTFNIPDGWLQAMIYRESGGNPLAINREPNGWTGIGLLQITHPSLKGAQRVTIDGKVKWVNPRPDSEFYYPPTNLHVGAKYVKELISRYGRDFPKVAAAFNAGSVMESQQNPWGMVSSGNHISEEVAALNTWLLARAKQLNLTVARTLMDLTDLAREADDAARNRDTDPPPAA